MLTIVRLFTDPAGLAWWEWGRLLGVAALAALGIALAIGLAPPPAVVAVLLHIAADFTFQSAETAERKGERGRHLIVHALAAGGLPLALAALRLGSRRVVSAGDLDVVPFWALAGAATHYAVDWTRKFGLRHEALATALDQLCHLAVILLITLH